MNELVVGVDGSDESRRAWRWAASVANTVGVRLVAVEAWSGGDPAAADETADRVRRNLADAATEVLGELGVDLDIDFEALPGSEVSSDIRPLEMEGEPRMELVNLAERLDVGLLVIGRRGKGTVRALRMGSVASHLVTSSPVPIAIIPPLPSSAAS